MEASVFFPQWEKYGLSKLYQTGKNVAGAVTYSCRAVGKRAWTTLVTLVVCLQSPGHKANTHHTVTKPETQLLEEK